MRPFRKVLLSFLVVGGLSMFSLAGTFATLTSESSNDRATIQSGSLTLSNVVSTTGGVSGSACLSYSSTTNSKSCDALFSSSTLVYPGQSQTIRVTVTNTGTIAGSNLSLYMPTCTAAASPGAPSPGGGNPCASGGPALTISETNSSWASPSCVFPTFGGTCSYTAGTLYFMSTKKDTSHLYSLAEGLAVGQSRYFVISLQLPTTSANTLQGEQARFDLTWLLSQ